jgi:8-oxoguanine deaminase
VPTLLVRNATVVATMDEDRREIAGGGLYVDDGIIRQVGSSETLPDDADEVVDLSGHVVLPGLVNTHHHFFQTLTRAIPTAQNAGLFEWLRVLYPIWARIGPDDVRAATQIALAELALSGCTTAADHQYLFPNGASLTDQFEAAAAIGLRFHGGRGSMSLGEASGGLPPDPLVEDEKAIVDDTAQMIDRHHDAEPGSMAQVIVAPCSPFSVTLDLMRESAQLARDKGVMLHTHLAETIDEEGYCLEHHGRRPVELMADLGWVGDDVWYAHAVFATNDEIAMMGGTGTGVAHCPTSNMRLASGLAPVRKYLASGVRVGLGVDGSASNDGSHMLAEARQAMLLARLDAAPSMTGGELLSARTALEMATRGGAEILGRFDIGSLEVGKCADFVAISLDRLEYAGTQHDPLAAVVFAAPVRVDHTYVHGRPVVRDGELVTADVGRLIEAHESAVHRVVRG